MTCCNHNCDEGRDCPKRLAFQLHRLSTLDAAHKRGFLETEPVPAQREINAGRLPSPVGPSEAATMQADLIGKWMLIAAGALAALIAMAVAADSGPLF